LNCAELLELWNQQEADQQTKKVLIVRRLKKDLAMPCHSTKTTSFFPQFSGAGAFITCLTSRDSIEHVQLKNSRQR
jgi:hypothetical protein